MSPRTSFSKRLEFSRKKLGLSMKDVAKQVGVSESTYRGWEYGSEIRGEKYYQPLAKALHMGMDELITGEQPSEKTKKGLALIQEGLTLLKSN